MTLLLAADLQLLESWALVQLPQLSTVVGLHQQQYKALQAERSTACLLVQPHLSVQDWLQCPVLPSVWLLVSVPEHHELRAEDP